MTGYLHPFYARSFSEFGTPLPLPLSKGWVLERRIPQTPYRDAMGCYPLFCCLDWGQLSRDLDDLGQHLLSLALVVDPFGDYTPDLLASCFPDMCRPFKEHCVIDLERPPEAYVCRHHQRYVRKALKKVTVEDCENPQLFLDEWTRLYSILIQRHGISSLLAFSKETFSRQLQVPGLVAFRAEHEGATVAMVLWYVQGQVAYYHLGASDAAGYELCASFGLFWHAIEYFRCAGTGVRWLDLGAGAGTKSNGSDGLSRFKRGWSTGTRTSYLCGRILDRHGYWEVVKAKGISTTDYFPAYRSGEFA